MKAAVLLVTLLTATPAVADGVTAANPTPNPGTVLPPAKKGYSYPECYCTDSEGKRVEVGELACLHIGSRTVTSRCEKARNLVIWRHQKEGCQPGV